MKSSDEIKKGLECCSAHGRSRSTDCKSCPFRWKTPGCEFRMHRQALALLRHRERENAQQAETIERLNAGAHKLIIKVRQLEAERDAAVETIYEMAKSITEDVCEWCDGVECEHLCMPHTILRPGFKWRGVQKEDGDA